MLIIVIPGQKTIMLKNMTTTPTATRTRPYWHVDLKWIFGILLFFALGATLLLYNLSSLTERNKAINISATIVASLFSRNGLDDPSGLDAFRQKIAANPSNQVSPIEEFPWLQVSKHDALTLSPKDLKIDIFSQLTGPIYDKGVKGAATTLTPDPTQQAKFINDVALLGLFTKETHDILQRTFIVTLIVSLICAVAVIYFSAGWGKLVSIGLRCIAVSPVGACASILLLHPPDQ